MQEELKALISLINSWQAENIELAFEIMKGHKVLKAQASSLYSPILQVIGKPFSKATMLKLPAELSYAKHASIDIPQTAEMEAIFATIPVGGFILMDKG
jgi:hypothetical protein